MALTFHPDPGSIFVCNYDTGSIDPEMTKIRLCVVITPRLRKRDRLCTVVPLSTTNPHEVCDYHRRVEFPRELPKPWGGPGKWAKCDMFSTVSYDRLTPIGVGKDQYGKRKYIYPKVSGEQLRDIRAGVLCALALQNLTSHL